MAISFDTTVGGTASNSYVTVAEFNTYTEKMLDTSNLPTASQTTIIKKILIAATEVIDQEDFDGWPTETDTQFLEFPRLGMVDRRGYQIAETLLPQELKDATCELAIWLYQHNLNNAQHDGWEDEMDSATIGSDLSMSFAHNQHKPSTLLPARVRFLLQRMGTLIWLPNVTRVRRS